ncbi:hypothetical protein ACIBEK_33555 [Nocardia fusca]|uniref:hypothetical protein n=1 Tax=Nocardia fusca TaxID=941183 RepID=UPI00379431E1
MERQAGSTVLPCGAQRRSVGHLERLVRAREVLAGAGLEVAGCRLACFSGTGFSEALRERAREDPDVLLIGLSDLYGR